jgi:hypothetical protein
LCADIAFFIIYEYTKCKPRGSVNFRPGSNPQHEDEVMSQANVSTTLIRSRRAVLAGIAAAAATPIAAAIPTVAPAMALSAEQAVDPIFAALDAYRAANAEFYGDWPDEIPDEVGDRWSQAVDAVIGTQPTTPAGLGALTSFARDMVERAHSGDASFTVRQKLLVMSAIDDATRGMSGLTPWSPPVDVTTPAKVRTPAIEAIERDRKAWKRVSRCYDKLDETKRAAKEELGSEPYALIHWRNFYIGGSELKRTRETLIARGEDPATIESEYHDAKKRYRAQVKAAKDWEKRAGLDGLCKSLEQAQDEGRAAQKALGVVQIQSVADAAALLEWLRSEVKHGDIQPWEIAALNNASKFLRKAAAA